MVAATPLLAAAQEATPIPLPVIPEVAWYSWWIDIESGRLLREVMISRAHYMISEFSDFDAPIEIVPPTLPSGTPIAPASPVPAPAIPT